MNVLEIPFNKFIGIEKSEQKEDSIFEIKQKDEYLNHLGTLHASVLFAIAEATSGEFLLNQFQDLQSNIIPVVRKVEVKYSKPVTELVYSKAKFSTGEVEEILKELNEKKRVIIKVQVDLFGKNSERCFTSVFDWFISLP